MRNKFKHNSACGSKRSHLQTGKDNSHGQFIIYWEEGLTNFADYFTKHFSSSYHQKIRSTYILKGYNISAHTISPQSAGCVDSLPGLTFDSGLKWIKWIQKIKLFARMRTFLCTLEEHSESKFHVFFDPRHSWKFINSFSRFIVK